MSQTRELLTASFMVGTVIGISVLLWHARDYTLAAEASSVSSTNTVNDTDMSVVQTGDRLTISDKITEEETVSVQSFPIRVKEENRYKQGDFQAGVAVMLYSMDYIDLADLDWKLNDLYDRLINAHVNIVSVNWPIYTDGIRSNRVYKGKGTPSNEALRYMIRKASERNLAVVIRPILDEKAIVAENKQAWRGTILPKDSVAWFKNYGALMMEYARLAEEEKASILVVGVELVSMEKHASKWRRLIKNIRSVFSGEITYSSNRDISDQIPWDILDFISLDIFLELDTPPNATKDDIVREWQRWVKKLERTAQKHNKPLVLTEIGSTSQTGAHRRSWVWNHRSAVDQRDQQQYYKASCVTWKKRVRGIYWWAANVWMPEDPAKDRGFTPMGKLAEAEIASCYRS